MQAQMHPLYPILDGINRKFALYDRQLCQIENKVENIQSETAKIVQLQKELMQLMKQHQKKNYSLGDDGFDVALAPIKISFLCDNYFA